MLILREKTTVVDGRSVKLYSLDGRLWFSKAGDLKEFKRRQARAKAIVQIYFEHWDVRYLPA